MGKYLLLLLAVGGLCCSLRAPEAQRLIDESHHIKNPWERYVAMQGSDPESLNQAGLLCNQRMPWTSGAPSAGCTAIYRWWSAQRAALRDALKDGDERARDLVFVARADDPSFDQLREQLEPGATARRKERATAQAQVEQEGRARQETADKQIRIGACRTTCAPYAWSFIDDGGRGKCACTSSEQPAEALELSRSEGCP